MNKEDKFMVGYPSRLPILFLFISHLVILTAAALGLVGCASAPPPAAVMRAGEPAGRSSIQASRDGSLSHDAFNL